MEPLASFFDNTVADFRSSLTCSLTLPARITTEISAAESPIKEAISLAMFEMAALS